MKTYTLSDFDFDLPKKLIAQQPASPRDAARLLVYNRTTKEITDTIFRDIANFLEPKTALVVNNSKVEKCRYSFGKKELFVLETVNDTTVVCMVFPGRDFKLGKTVQLADGLVATVMSINESGHRTLQITKPLTDAAFDENRYTPLPPYIAQDESLSNEYQTVYAKELGSKAAPTAGLHFTESLLRELRGEHDVIETTLDVGLGTFAPIKQEDLSTVSLHEERFAISADAAVRLSRATHRTAVGTTSVRVLESAVSSRGDFGEVTDAATDIFIQPGYNFKAVDSLITNFHLPKSSLLMLVSAFVGFEEMHMLYAHAIKEQYRFYSFGDAMLIV
jgi:S-adenosylmethionine:tRNA ribosyltransferase-isomerase